MRLFFCSFSVFRLRAGFIFLVALLLCCTACHRPPLPSGGASRARGVYHTVQKGQTLWRICKTYKVNMQYVAEINNIRNHSQIKAGDRLFIPGATKKLWVARSVKPSGTSKPSTKPTPEPRPPIIKKNTGMFIWPLIGPVIKRFGIHGGLKHDGIAIRGKPGAEVRASRGGKVIFASQLEGYGDTVIIQHDSHFVTVYANLGAILVKRDQKVAQSRVLGRLQSSPSDRCHLSFQVRRDRKARNPLFYLPEAR